MHINYNNTYVSLSLDHNFYLSYLRIWIIRVWVIKGNNSLIKGKFCWTVTLRHIWVFETIEIDIMRSNCIYLSLLHWGWGGSDLKNGDPPSQKKIIFIFFSKLSIWKHFVKTVLRNSDLFDFTNSFNFKFIKYVTWYRTLH